MKIKDEDKQTIAFKPVNFTLIIESQEELDKLYCLFNCIPILNYFKIEKKCVFRDLLTMLGAKSPNKSWHELMEIIK